MNSVECSPDCLHPEPPTHLLLKAFTRPPGLSTLFICTYYQRCDDTKLVENSLLQRVVLVSFI